jgi:hypothetical protein
MTVTNDLEGRVDAPAPLEMPCPACGGGGSRQFFLPHGWETVRDMLLAANEVREANSSARLIDDRQRLEQAWHDMRVAWALARRIDLVQDVGAYWCGMARSGFNNIIGGRTGDRRRVAPINLPTTVPLYGEPTTISIPCSRCGGTGVLRFSLTPEQVEVLNQLKPLGNDRRGMRNIEWTPEHRAYEEPMGRSDKAIQDVCHRGAELGLTQELMAHVLGMSRAGLIGILKAGRRS